MLRMYVRIAAVGALAAALTACGNAGSADVVAETDGTAALLELAPTSQELCTAAGKDVSLVGEAPVTFVRGGTTTTADANAWLSQQPSTGGPSVSVDDYSKLDSKAAPGAPFTVCVFKSSVPRPIPLPPGVKIVANGTRIFAQAPDRFVVDAIGDVDRIAAQLDTLKTTESSAQ